mmetsp:Transcript_37735/g.87172  ORF Transcript_37735/g.87172 Transcript_37735/m.87172 type:complete len:213 (+) Transcript_37735:50-688(+)
MGIPAQELVHPESVPSVLECVICTEVLLDAVECPHCQVAACRECITPWLSSKGTCPQCRQKTAQFSPAHRIVRAQLGALLVRCTQENCTWTGTLESREGHECKTALESTAEVVEMLKARLAEKDAKIAEQQKVISMQSAQLQTLERQRFAQSAQSATDALPGRSGWSALSGSGDPVPICRRPGCTFPSWDGRPGGFCTRSCRDRFRESTVPS